VSALRPENRALFRAAQADFEPSEADRERVEKALAMTLGTAVGASAGAVGTSAAAPAGAAHATASGVTAMNVSMATVAGVAGASAKGVVVGVGMGAVQWLSIVAVVAAVGGMGVVALRPAPAQPPPAVSASPAMAPVPLVSTHGPLTRVVAALPVTPAATNTPQPAPQASVPPAALPIAPHAPAGSSLPSTVALAETRVSQEARLLHDAQNAIRMGDTAMALRLLDEHARTFPHGVLEEEREAERALLTCGSGGGGREAGERFLRQYPDSPLVTRVRSACLAP